MEFLAASAVMFNAASPEAEDLSPSQLVTVAFLGGFIALIVVCLMCSECLARYSNRRSYEEVRSQTVDEQGNRFRPLTALERSLLPPTALQQPHLFPMPSRRYRPSAPVAISQPRVRIDIESDPSSMDSVPFRAYRQPIQSAEEAAIPSPHQCERLQTPAESPDYDRFSVVSNSAPRSDLESTYVNRMHHILDDLDSVPLYRPRNTPPPDYEMIMGNYGRTPPPNYATWMALNKGSPLEDVPSPLGSSPRDYFEEEGLMFYLSMSSKSDEEKTEGATGVTTSSVGKAESSGVTQGILKKAEPTSTVGIGKGILRKAEPKADAEVLKSILRRTESAEGAKGMKGILKKYEPEGAAGGTKSILKKYEPDGAMGVTKSILKKYEPDGAMGVTKSILKKSEPDYATNISRGYLHKEIEGARAEPKGPTGLTTRRYETSDSEGATGLTMRRCESAEPEGATYWTTPMYETSDSEGATGLTTRRYKTAEPKGATGLTMRRYETSESEGAVGVSTGSKDKEAKKKKKKKSLKKLRLHE